MLHFQSFYVYSKNSHIDLTCIFSRDGYSPRYLVCAEKKKYRGAQYQTYFYPPDCPIGQRAVDNLSIVATFTDSNASKKFLKRGFSFGFKILMMRVRNFIVMII